MGGFVEKEEDVLVRDDHLFGVNRIQIKERTKCIRLILAYGRFQIVDLCFFSSLSRASLIFSSRCSLLNSPYTTSRGKSWTSEQNEKGKRLRKCLRAGIE